MAAGAGLGAICTALLLGTAGGPDPVPSPGLDRTVFAPTGAAPALAEGDLAASPAVAEVDRTAGADMPLTAGTAARPSAAEWEAAVEAALEHELALVEAHLRDAGHGAPRLVAADRAPMDPEAAARAEAALDLSRRDRRELQRRLALAEHDPRLVDGIFGPATRAAIAAWQAAAGLPPTGFLDGDAVALLERQTEERFRAWQVATERDRRRRQTRMASAASPGPTAIPASANCQRNWSGQIAYGQNVACDLRGLRENVAHLLGVADRS